MHRNTFARNEACHIFGRTASCNAHNLECLAGLVGACVFTGKTLANGKVPIGSRGVVKRFVEDLDVEALMWLRDEELHWDDARHHRLARHALRMVNVRCLWPVVEFIAHGAKHEVVCRPEFFTQQTVHGVTVNNRIMIPVQLAWAINAHRAQSMTMPRAVVHLDEFWATGQAYSAIARTPGAVETVGWLGTVCVRWTGMCTRVQMPCSSCRCTCGQSCSVEHDIHRMHAVAVMNRTAGLTLVCP